MVFVRKLVSICLHYNIVFKAKHIPGVHKKLVDALSRLLVHNCTRLAPAYMDPFPQGGFPVSAASELGNIVTMHASSSLQLSSIPTYKRAWRLFHRFLNAIFQTVSTVLPISPNTIAVLSVICLISSMHLQLLAPMFRLKATLTNFFVLMIPLKPFLLSECSKATIKRVLVRIAIFLSPSQCCTNYLIRRVIWLFIGIKFVNSRPCVLQIFMLFYGLVR